MQRRNFFLACAAASLNSVVISIFFQTPIFFEGLGASSSQIGSLIGLTLIPVAFCSPIAGRLVDRYPASWVIGFGALLYTVATLGHAYVSSFSVLLYMLRILQGVGNAFVFSPCFAAAAKSVPDDCRSQGIAYFAFTIQIGNALGSVIGAKWIDHHLSFLGMFYLAAFISLLSVIPAIMIRMEPEGVAAKNSSPILSFLFGRALFSGFLVIFVMGGIFGTLLQFTPAFFKSISGMGIAPISSMFFLTSTLLTILLARLFFGKLGDSSWRHPVMLVTYAMMVIGVFLVSQVTSKEHAILSGVVYGLGYGILYPCVNAMIMNRSPAGQKGAIAGLLATCFNCGYYGFAFFFGPLVQIGGYVHAFQFLALLVILTAVIFALMEKQRGIWFQRIGKEA